jgi:hypothetical protein
MAVACIRAPSLQLGDPTATLHLDYARGMLQLVEVRCELLLTQGEYFRGPELIECRSKRAHRTNDDRQRAFATQ